MLRFPSYRSCLSYLLFSAILLLPFNRSPKVPLLGELSLEASVYPVLLGITLLIINRKFNFTKHISFILLGVLFLWSLISGIVNIDDISKYYTKGRSGYSRLILQSLVYLFMLSGALFIYQAVNKLGFITNYLLIRKWIIISFIITAFYSVFEIALLYGVTELEGVIKFVNKVIHDNPMLYYRGKRLHSVSGEPSWYANYLALIFPWLLSYFLYKDKKTLFNYLFMLYFSFLVFFSFSRAAYAIIILESIIFFLLMIFYKQIKFGINSAILSGFIIFFIVQLFNINSNIPVISDKLNYLAPTGSGVTDPNNFQRSNLGRTRSQLAALNMAIDNPIFGIGMGQYGFLMPSYISKDAFSSFEVHQWVATDIDSPWPPVHGLHARIVAEQGFVGLLLWLSVWVTLTFSIWKKCHKEGYENQILGIILLSSLGGVFLLGFSIGTYRVFEFWFAIAFGWSYLESDDLITNQENSL